MDLLTDVSARRLQIERPSKRLFAFVCRFLQKNRRMADFFAERNFRLCWKNTFFLRIAKGSIPHNVRILSAFCQNLFRMAESGAAFPVFFSLFASFWCAISENQKERKNLCLLSCHFAWSARFSFSACGLSGAGRVPALKRQSSATRESRIFVCPSFCPEIRASRVLELTI